MAKQREAYFQHAEAGIEDYLTHLVQGTRRLEPVHTNHPSSSAQRSRTTLSYRVLILQWTDVSTKSTCSQSFVNGIPTGSGGTHENGFAFWAGKAIRNYIDTHKLQPKGVTLSADDVREGIIGRPPASFFPIRSFRDRPRTDSTTRDLAAQDRLARSDPRLEQWLN